jgi:Tfp pilus assembly protein FimT
MLKQIDKLKELSGMAFASNSDIGVSKMRPIVFEDQRGVSMLELMVVAAILVFLSLLMVPNFISNITTNKLKADAMDLANNLKFAKMKAVARNMDAGVHFFSDREAYCVFIDINENNQFDDTVDELLKSEIELRGGVSFDRGTDWTVEDDTIIFTPTGSVSAGAGTVVLKNNRNQKRKVIVTPVTGRVRISQ